MENQNKAQSILVLGGSGQVGSELRDVYRKHDYKYYFPSSKILNITKENTIKKFLSNNKIDLILNFAAYTNVDRAEKEKKISQNINCNGASSLARIAQNYKVGVIQFSTDYVFGKGSSRIRKVNDKTSPVNHYGLSKSKGEKEVLRKNELGFIIRIASVYSKYGRNFVKTMIKLLLAEEEVKVISDQKISVTSAYDTANNIPYLIELYKKNIKEITNSRIIHFTNKGYTTWFRVAKVIRDELMINDKKRSLAKIIPIKAHEWKSLAKRPLDSRLKVDFRSLEREDIVLPSWDEGVRSVVKEILQKGLY